MSLPAGERQRLERMFAEYRATGDRRVRNALIEAHRPLAAHLARRYANRGEPFDDLFQVASLGMLKAVERFDPDRNLEFSTFATATVEGELKRHFRDRTWSIRVPRRQQELYLRLGDTIGDLSQRLRRAPRIDEIARELAVPEEDVLEAMEAGDAYRCTSIDSGATDADGPTMTLEQRLGEHDDGFDHAEHRVVLARLLAELPERERTILQLRFFRDMSQTEIANAVGVSQMHVSRLLARTLVQLRARLHALDA